MNKRAKERSKGILGFLGFNTKEKADKMTNQDWEKFNNSYKEKYGISFTEDLEKPDENEPPTTEGNQTEVTTGDVISSEMQQQILAVLTEAAEASGTNAPENPPATVGAVMQSFITAMNDAVQTIRTLSANAESNVPAAVVSGASQNGRDFAVILGHVPHTATHLFGIEDKFFSRENWWNSITATRVVSNTDYTTDEISAFREAFNFYGKTMKNRVNALVENGQIALLDYKKMIAGESSIDYSELEKEFGKRYMVRRQDMIIAYLRTLESVNDIFPVRSNVQDKETVVNAFFSEFSQAFQPGRVFKGGVKFTPEIYHVDDVMFKHLFDNLKDLERQYIGYLNKEGSNPMKWTFIEWLLANIYTVLFNEQQRRRVIGVRCPVQEGVDNPAVLAADGIIRSIWRVIEQRKILPFMDLKVYDETTMLEYAEEMWQMIMAILPNMAGMRMYANKKHRPWFLKNFREKYSKDGDFTGVKDSIMDLSPESIIWVPNMDMNDYLMWVTVPGNAENYELTPGEMYAVYFQQDLESLISASWWKEGAGLQMAGLQCETIAELEKTGRRFQYIFTNYPVTKLQADETKLNGLDNTVFETGENASAVAITDIENASVERVYKIICGSLTNKTTIKKSGKFENIKSTWEPASVGDYITVYAELKKENQTIAGKQVQVTVPTGNFLELDRRVTA
ncbi:MAG: hypothetical protein FWF54_03300 [Candidatus Azobacteroides sp.]|nr:hypothetical protein [Candidatus Azobacteroides sp.]